MTTPLPPDPYVALGVAKDATATAIKSQYRKLVLKFHPDKVQDESKKSAAADQFHKIQQAYEIVSDDDRRARYDAQCKLAELRKEMLDRAGGCGRGGVDVRTAGYKLPPESPRGGEFYPRGPERFDRVSPLYEERRPSYAPSADYFDVSPRTTARKDAEYERSSKRTSPREDREKSRHSTRDTKESERSSRREKSRRTEKDIRRDRDRKQPAYTYVEEDASSDSDQRERARRQTRDEVDGERAARDSYHKLERKQQEEAAKGFFPDDRTRKLFSHIDSAKEHIERTGRSTRQRPESTQRPSPIQTSFPKDKVEYIKRKDGGSPVMVRRGSGRPRTAAGDAEPRKSSPRAKDRKSSIDIVEEPHDREPRRPPTLNQSKSSPADIRIPFERQRSNSAQVEIERDILPQVKRAETMPYESNRTAARDTRRRESTAPVKNSGLRQAEVTDAYPTPEHSPEPTSRRYHYGQEYADDVEYPTPDGYRTEIREPSHSRRTQRSPSPMERDTRDRQQRPSSAKYPPGTPSMSRTTSYVYPDAGLPPPRPGMSRENSARNASMLYGEVPTTASMRSPKPSQSSKYPSPVDGVHYQREYRPEDIKAQTGYSRRRTSADDRQYGRTGTSSPIYVRA